MNALLTDELIQFVDRPLSWSEAIVLSGQPLVDAGIVEPRYLDAMVETVHQSGAYIVLAPRVAVPHARPEAGANGEGLAVLRTIQPVSFSDVDAALDPVELFFALAASDKDAHIGLLQKLALLLGDDENIEAMLAAPDAPALAGVIDRIVSGTGEGGETK